MNTFLDAGFSLFTTIQMKVKKKKIERIENKFALHININIYSFQNEIIPFTSLKRKKRNIMRLHNS